MANFDWASVVYLVLLLCAVGSWVFVQQRQSLGRVLQQDIAWVLIFAGVVAVFGQWEDLRSTLRPTASVTVDGGKITVPKANDGHFYMTLAVNGQPVDCMVDTGAGAVFLTGKDAQAAGVKTPTRIFSCRAMTANGEVRTAPIWLDTIGVGAVTQTGVRAWVNEGDMDQSLLGMSYLQGFNRIEMTPDTLILTR